MPYTPAHLLHAEQYARTARKASLGASASLAVRGGRSSRSIRLSALAQRRRFFLLSVGNTARIIASNNSVFILHSALGTQENNLSRKRQHHARYAGKQSRAGLTLPLSSCVSAGAVSLRPSYGVPVSPVPRKETGLIPWVRGGGWRRPSQFNVHDNRGSIPTVTPSLYPFADHHDQRAERGAGGFHVSSSETLSLKAIH